MALPSALLDTFLPAELEWPHSPTRYIPSLSNLDCRFVAELEDVEIVPLFRMLPIRTIGVGNTSSCFFPSPFTFVLGHGRTI